MGQEIADLRFEHRDFARFGQRLHAETELLHDWIEGDRFSAHAPMLGLELEAWLVDAQMRPAPRNDELLAAVGSPDVVAELGRFNFELNVAPRPAAGLGLQQLGDDLAALWARCRTAAASLGLQAVAIGILPTVRDGDLTLAAMSDRARYRALNQQVQRQRHGRGARLDIDGPGGAHLAVEHQDVMLEAAATSFQVHLQVPAAEVLRTYNAALIASASTVALSGNSPLLFGHRLWQETRVPLFEQALGVGSREGAAAGTPISRVTFGDAYAGWSLAECFRDNAARFEPLLPLVLEEPPEQLAHLRLHNGTIWRWNRPLVGFDADGRPHLRIEHRPMAAGPTVGDMMANLAFSIGLITALAAQDTPPESTLPFEAARDNFMAAARHGLAARLRQPDGHPCEHRTARDVLLHDHLPLARAGLARLGTAPDAADQAIGLLRERVSSGQTGAVWQCRHLDRHGHDPVRLLADYIARQASGEPVHRWR